jgi:outer membrane lipoprotein-sorting protein
MFRQALMAALTTAVVVLATGSTDTAAAQAETDAVEVMKQAHLNLYYMGDDGRAVVEMKLVDKKGKSRSRKFIMYRLDVEDGGKQKYYTYFLEPGDVRRTSFMVWKEPAKDDSRWIYIPSVDLVKRISANDKGSSFVGSDFSYEDVSGRHWNDDTHTLVREEELDGKMAYVIESIPTGKDAFAKKITWVGKDEMVPLREEYYDKKDRLERVFEALKIQEVGGFLTVTERKMTNVKKDHHTLVIFSDIEYNIGVEDKLFTERYLKAPPADLISG